MTDNQIPERALATPTGRTRPERAVDMRVLEYRARAPMTYPVPLAMLPKKAPANVRQTRRQS